VLNFCANNYLGLADHPQVIAGGARGAGPLGLRHGLRALHLRHAATPQATRTALSDFLGTEDTILYSSCFDANGGLFETLLAAGRRHHLR
jgi:glycine C-acetyltransferase